MVLPNIINQLQFEPLRVEQPSSGFVKVQDLKTIPDTSICAMGTETSLAEAFERVCAHHHLDPRPNIELGTTNAKVTRTDIQGYIDQNSNLSVGAKDALFLFADLSEKTEVPPSIIQNVVLDGRAHSILEMIQVYYQTWSTHSDMRDTAAALFKRFPAFVTANLVEDHILEFPAELRSDLVALLRTEQLDFLSNSIDTFSTTIENAFKESDPQQKEVVFRFLRMLQSLSLITQDAIELQILISQGYNSPDKVAYVPWDYFRSRMISNKLEESRAATIHSKARAVQIQTEQAWMTMLQGERVNQIFTGIPSKKVDQPPATQRDVDGTKLGESRKPLRQETMADWFGDLDEMACEECCSATSPAAYLVDLLRMLKVAVVKPTSGASFTLLERLFQRRPDIGGLRLSCHNTNDIVPYLDLANEVMESTIAYLNKNPANGTKLDILPFNADDDIPGSRGSEIAQNTQISVYDDYVRKKVFPSSVFPFDYSRVSLQRYVAACGHTLAEVRAAFWPIIQGVASVTVGKHDDVLEGTLYRAQSADVLELSNQDFLALTGEGIFSLLATDSKVADAALYGGKPLPLSDYWGYDGSDATLILDESGDKGLVCIKRQLLPRLEIDFVTLCDILKTRYLNGCLTIALLPESVQYNETKNVPTQLEKFRLRGQKGGPLTGDDGIQSCHRLGQFVRIWQRLSWSIIDVDDALSAFGILKNGQTGSNSGVKDITQERIAIQPETIQQLAAVKELIKATTWSPKQIIALWNPGGSYIQELRVYENAASSNTANPPKVSVEEQNRFLALFLATIQMTYDDFIFIRAMQNLNSGLDLNRNTIFIYNREQSLAKLFEVTVPQLRPLFEVLSPKGGPDDSPRKLLEAWREWQDLKAAGWNHTTISGAKVLPDQVLKPSLALLDKMHSFIGQMVKAYVQLKQSATTAASQGTLRRTLSHTVEESVASILPKADMAVLKFLTNEITESSTGRPILTVILEELLRVKIDNAESAEARPDHSRSFDLPPGSGFVICNEQCDIEVLPSDGWEGKLTIGTRSYDVVKSPSGKSSTRDKGEKTLAKDILTWISSNDKPTPLKISVKDFQQAQIVTFAVMDQRSVSIIESALQQLDRFVHISNQNKLSLEDMGVLYGPDQMAWEGTEFETAQAYDKIRKNFQRAAPKFDFSKFHLWVSQQAQPGIRLLDELDRVASLSPGLFKALLRANFPDLKLDSSELKEALLEREVLERISLQMALLKRLDLGIEAIEPLLRFALPEAGTVANGSSSGDSVPATTRLVQLMKSAQLGKGRVNTVRNVEDQLRVQRRRALVAYLLQHPFFREKPEVNDADGLFEYFLIDVQMGACLETSRIKQAISTVQLFVQRCLLGLEAGVDPGVIDGTRWSWMQKHTLWEANRKVFLYPENWIDPSLRDNKTEVFKLIETSIMQTNLDDKTIAKMIRSYVYAIDEIANLRIESVFWEPLAEKSTAAPRGSPSEGDFHFFARTRNAPFQFYYRSMSYKTQGALPTADWIPWQKIPLDIQVHDTDAAGESLPETGTYMVPAKWKNRLLLFLPQVMMKVIPKKNSTTPVSVSQTGGLSASISSTGPQSETKIEIKMSWSEYLEDSWLPPVQAHESIRLSNQANINQDISAFRFLVESNAKSQSSFSVYVFNTTPGMDEKASPSTVLVGRFELQGSRLLKIDPDNNTSILSNGPATSFGRLAVTLKDGVRNAARTKYSDPVAQKGWPYLSKPARFTDAKEGNITWTLDSALRWQNAANNTKVVSKTLGLCADIPVKGELGNETWFTLPEFANSTESDWRVTPHDDQWSTTLHNPLGNDLRHAVTEGDGLSSIFKLMDEMAVVSSIAKASTSNRDTRIFKHAFGLFYNLLYCYENSTPFAIYNWELGFHLVSLIVERLFSLQQFDLAINYARLVFDPTLNQKGQDRWRFPPFRDQRTREAGTMDALLDGLTPTSGTSEEKSFFFLQWETRPFMPHVVARGRPLAYMKRFAMKYTELLIASGDKYFRQPSLEAIPLAIQRYVEASHVLGPAPQKIPRVGQPKFKSYNELDTLFDNFANASVDFQLTFPYTLPAKAGDTEASSLPGWAKTRYFGVQSNPEFSALRALVNDRLDKIRSCLDIDGKPRKLRLFDPPIDPGAIVKALAGNADLGAVLSGFNAELPRQRFMYLLQKAQELCAELKQAAASFLTIIEKREGEGFQLLRARHDSNLQTFLIDMKTKQKKEADKGIEHLQEARKSAVTRLQFYSDLTGDKQKPPAPGSDFEEINLNIPEPSKDEMRLTGHELTELESADYSHYLSGLAINQDFWAAIMSKIPMPCLNVQPGGIGVSTQMPSLSEVFQYEASRLRADAGMAMEVSQRGARMAQFTRQLQERRLQINLAGREIKAIDKQIEMQMAHIAVIDQDIRAQKKQADNAAEAEEFLRAKFTRQELYGWLETSTRTLLYQIYDLTMQLARKAETAFKFEADDSNKQSFISAAGYWEGGRQGIDAGEHLWFALKRMELAYVEGRYHDFEISKDISLRSISASQLLRLRREGVADFEVPEALFDLDFPGHYRRRIKTVALSLHCIAGPYTSANATLTLTSHTQRLSTDLVEGEYRRKSAAALNEPDPKDTRFSDESLKLPIMDIAISSGQADSGVFELDFRGSDYQPFEGAGAISKWKLQLPSKFRQFDYSTISDVVLHLRYTSKRSSMPAFLTAVDAGMQAHLKQAGDLSKVFGLHMLISIRSDYPDAWYPFATETPANQPKLKRTVTISRFRDRLPYFLRSQKKLTVTAVSFHVSFEGAKPTSLSILPGPKGVDDPKRIVLDPGTDPKDTTKAATKTEDVSTEGVDQNMAVFRWPDNTRNREDTTRDTIGDTTVDISGTTTTDATRSESSEPKPALLLAEETASLSYAVDFGNADPKAGRLAYVVLEYQLG